MSDSGTTSDGQPIAAGAVIAAFGGIRPTAHKLGIAVSTVQGWKERDQIPAGRRTAILAAAALHDVSLTEEDLRSRGTDTVEDVVAEKVEAPAASPWREPEARQPEAAAPEPEPDADAQAAREEAPDEPVVEPRDTGRAAAAPGRSIAGTIAAGVVGGLVVCAVAAGLWYGGALPSAITEPAPPAVDAERLAALQDRLDTLAGSVSTIDGLRAEAAELRRSLSLLDERVAAVESTPAAAGAPDGSLVARLDDLQGRLDALDSRLETLAARPASGDTPAVADVEQEIDARLSDLRRNTEAAAENLRQENAGLRRALDGVVDRLAALEAGADASAETTAANGARLIAVGQLRDAVRDGGPYADALDAVAGLVPASGDWSAAVDALRPNAESGLPALDDLRRAFADLAPEIVAAGRRLENADWIDRALAAARNVVSVRRVGADVEGESAEAVVARAEARVAAGDLAGAVTELEGLAGAAAETAAPWLADARRVVAAESALSRLQTLTLAALSDGETAQ